MKRIAWVLAVPLLFAGCGDEGIGFNVRKDFGVVTPVVIDLPDISVPEELRDFLDINPPSENFNYNLNEVGAFDDALEDDLDDLGSIEVNELAYEVTGIDTNEQVPLDELSISLTLAGQPVQILSADGSLANQARRVIELTEAQRQSIIDELFNSEEVNIDVVFDLSEIPTNTPPSLEFDFVFYFDVTLKARDL